MKTALCIALLLFLLYELFEHVVFPLVWFLLRGKKTSRYGPKRLVGKEGQVKKWLGKEGYVFVDGELWKAVCRSPLKAGDRVIVQKIEGLTLTVDIHRTSV